MKCETFFTVQDFFTRFPNDDACLEYLMLLRFGKERKCPKCKKQSKFHRIKKMPAYGCQWCGHHIHPMVNTPFERSSTPLQKWFYAMYLFTTSRHGVPAKEIQRQLGVTYKTAWRIATEIRKYMGKVDGNDKLSGHVEVDETLIGGASHGKRGRGATGKTIVMGMLQRNGNVMTKIVRNVKKDSLHPVIKRNIEQGSTISSDELKAYQSISKLGYVHGKVNHHMNEYVDGIHHVNNIEGFWSQIKRSIKGTHIHVSKKHLPKYLGEFEFRYNMRNRPFMMFSRLLASF